MKKLDLNKAKDIELLKENLDKVFDKKIEMAKINENIVNLKNVGFNGLKFLFENISDKLYSTDNGKKLIKEFVDTVKSSKDLHSLYSISSIIKKSNLCENTELLLNESISIFKLSNKLEKNIAKLRNVVAKSLKESKISSSELNKLLEEYNDGVNYSLDFITENKKTSGNIHNYVNNMDKVISFLKENKSNVPTISENLESPKEILRKYTNSIENSSLNEWEKKAIKDITLYTISGKDKKELFETYKTSCLNSLNEMLESDNIEDKAEISTIKEKLSLKEYNANTLNEDILTLAELKNMSD